MKLNKVNINFEKKILNFKNRMETFEFYFEKAIIKIFLPHALAKNKPSKVEIYEKRVSLTNKVLFMKIGLGHLIIRLIMF